MDLSNLDPDAAVRLFRSSLEQKDREREERQAAQAAAYRALPAVTYVEARTKSTGFQKIEQARPVIGDDLNTPIRPPVMYYVNCVATSFYHFQVTQVARLHAEVTISVNDTVDGSYRTATPEEFGFTVAYAWSQVPGFSGPSKTINNADSADATINYTMPEDTASISAFVCRATLGNTQGIVVHGGDDTYPDAPITAIGYAVGRCVIAIDGGPAGE